MSNAEKLKPLKLTITRVTRFGRQWNDDEERSQEPMESHLHRSIRLDKPWEWGGLPKGRVVEIYGT